MGKAEVSFDSRSPPPPCFSVFLLFLPPFLQTPHLSYPYLLPSLPPSFPSSLRPSLPPSFRSFSPSKKVMLPVPPPPKNGCRSRGSEMRCCC